MTADGAKLQEFYSATDYVLITKRRYEADWKDEELLKQISDDSHREFRSFLKNLRDNGLECEGFLDGPCGYCGICAYPEPCRFPEMKVASISTLGLDLGRYLGSVGEKFEFTEGIITLYGLVFVRRRT